ncbi:MAG: hypothetical protein AAF152_16640 [Cyanobacteria bacterium P01_A01_bin.114]
MTLTPVELKFLLRLLGAPGYRTAITAIKPNPKTKARERDSICMSLCSKGLVEYTAEVAQFAIAPAGRTLLNLDTTSLPVTPSELWTLKSCRQKTITPGQINRKVPVSDRQAIIQTLGQRGLVNVKKNQLKEVWLTAQGQQFLLNDYQPQGTASIISGNLLNHYVQFLRRAMTPGVEGVAIDRGAESAGKPNESAVLETITRLDRQLNTDNYLPLFHLRDQLPLSRDELDRHLYELQRLDKIELSTLQDVTAYSEAQLAAGIPQDVGGALFFVSVN